MMISCPKENSPASYKRSQMAATALKQAGAETRWILENAVDYREVGHTVIPVTAAVPDAYFY